MPRAQHRAHPLPGNLGQTAPRPRRRTRDPMAAFDALPPPLRAWLAQAVLPWSAASCLRIWRRMRADGADADAVLAALSRAEAQALSRDQRPKPVRCR